MNLVKINLQHNNDDVVVRNTRLWRGWQIVPTPCWSDAANIIPRI
jgi:hypothetical protein